MCAIFFFLPLLISWGAAVAVQWGTDWSKSVSAMHLSLSLSQNDFIIVWKKSKKNHFVLLTFTKSFFSALFVKDQNFSFCDAFIILLSQNVFIAVWERKKIFFLSHNDFPSLVLKKNVLKEKIYFFPQSNINFHVKKSTVFVFLNKKLYLRVRTVFFTDAFITFHFSKCFFLCLRTKCHWWLSVPKMS